MPVLHADETNVPKHGPEVGAEMWKLKEFEK
jgi:hypothetical protein